MVLKGVEKITRTKLIRNIQKELSEEYDIKLDYKTIKAVIELEEMEVYLAIGQNKSIEYIWGMLYGEDKYPKKLTGYHSKEKGYDQHYNFSKWKNGVPHVVWSKLMKNAQWHDASEFFNLPDHKYTTLAREYRRIEGLPELEEYKDLPEEKIIELCTKADEEEFHKIPLHRQFKLLNNKKHNDSKLRGAHLIWEYDNYVPATADVVYNDSKENSRKKKLKNLINVIFEISYDTCDAGDYSKQLEMVRRILDYVGGVGDAIEYYPELFKKEYELTQWIKQLKLKEIKHVNLCEKNQLVWDPVENQYYQKCPSTKEEKLELKKYWDENNNRINEARKKFMDNLAENLVEDFDSLGLKEDYIPFDYDKDCIVEDVLTGLARMNVPGKFCITKDNTSAKFFANNNKLNIMNVEQREYENAEIQRQGSIKHAREVKQDKDLIRQKNAKVRELQVERLQSGLSVSDDEDEDIRDDEAF